MIFLFQDCIDALQAQNPKPIHDIVSDLAGAHRAGHHLFVADRETIDWLLDNIAFNDRDIATLQSVRASYTQTANLVDNATAAVVVKPSNLSGARIDGRKVVLGLKDADWRYLLQRPNLLIENSLYDGTFIETILNSIKVRIGAPSISFDKRNGGGTGIFHVWEQQVSEGYIVCLIADSDRKHPGSVLDTKFKVATDYASARGHYLAYCYPLPCMEAENIVPMSVLEDLPCCQQKANQLSALKRIDEQEEASGIPLSDRFLLFYDMKNGVNNSHLECNNPVGAGDWYKQRIAMGGNAAHLSGISDGIIPQILREEKLLFRLSREATRNHRWLEVFGDFFADICWIGYAPRQYVL